MSYNTNSSKSEKLSNYVFGIIWLVAWLLIIFIIILNMINIFLASV